MNKDILQGHWKELKGKVKQQWGKLTDDELTRMSGKYEELEGLLEQKYGYSREEADKQLKDFLDKNDIH